MSYNYICVFSFCVHHKFSAFVNLVYILGGKWKPAIFGVYVFTNMYFPCVDDKCL